MTAFSAVFVAGLVLLALAAAVDLVSGVRWRRLLPVPYLAGAAGSACLAAAGAAALAGQTGGAAGHRAARPGHRPGRPPTRCPACSC